MTPGQCQLSAVRTPAPPTPCPSPQRVSYPVCPSSGPLSCCQSSTICKRDLREGSFPTWTRSRREFFQLEIPVAVDLQRLPRPKMTGHFPRPRVPVGPKPRRCRHSNHLSIILPHTSKTGNDEYVSARQEVAWEHGGTSIRKNLPCREIKYAIKRHHCSLHTSIGLRLCILYCIASGQK